MTGQERKRQYRRPDLDESGEKTVSRMASNLSTMMARMAKDTSTADFTLISGEFRRPIHSCVLANQSPYFEAVVKRWTQGEKEINVESCNTEVLNMAIDFMYGIQLDRKMIGDKPEMQEGLLELARRLLMDNLKIEVEKVILQTLSKDNFNQICEFAEDYESQVLAEQCAQYIVNKQITPDWKKMEKQPSVAACLAKHVRLDYVTKDNFKQLCHLAQKFLSNHLAEICARFIIKQNLILQWEEMEKIPIVTSDVHKLLMEKKARLELPVVPKKGKWKPATRRITNTLLMMKERVLEPVWNHQFAWPFHAPVDTIKLGIPDYFDFIKKPMDLGTIRERFDNNYYLSSDEAVADFNQVFENCYTYNPEDHEIRIMCKVVERFYHSKMAKLPEEDEVALHGDDLLYPEMTGSEDDMSDDDFL